MLEKFLTLTGYCTEEKEMAWEEKGERNKRTSQPFKVPASEVERGLSKARYLLAAIPDRKTLYYSFDEVFGMS